MGFNDAEKQTPKVEDKSKAFTKFIFFVFGVSSLSGWNALLTALDYFQGQYKDYQVSFQFPIPNFVSCCLIGLFLPLLSKYLSLTFRIAWSLIGVCIILILLPLVAQLLPNTTGFILKYRKKGYEISMGLIFIMGACNSLQQNTSIGISGVIGGEFIGIFFVGTGASGTIICAFRMICLSAIPDNQALSCLIYFCAAAVWNVLSIILFFSFQRTHYYQLIMNNEPQNSVSVADDVNIQAPLSTDETNTIDDNSNIIGIRPTDQLANKNIFQIVLFVHKLVFPVPFCIIINYIQTFMMFPGLSLKYIFTSNLLSWGPTLIIFTYNIGDLVGKYISNYRKTFNEVLLVVIVLVRFGFFAVFILIAQQSIKELWIVFLNMFIFAAMNGFVTGGLFQIGAEKVENSLKETVGFVSAFSLTFGIMSGTFLAISLEGIE